MRTTRGSPRWQVIPKQAPGGADDDAPISMEVASDEVDLSTRERLAAARKEDRQSEGLVKQYTRHVEKR